MEIKLIKFVNILECIFCLHRSISSSNCVIRVLICFHVFWELSVISLNCVKHHFYITQFVEKTEALFFFASTTNSLVLIILAVYKSKKYKQMLKYFNMNHLHLKGDPLYNKNLKTFLVLVMVISLVTFVMQVGTFISARFAHHFTIPDLAMTAYIFYFNLQMCDYRFIFEFFALFSILNVMSEQLTSITRSVNEFEVVKREANPNIDYKEKLKVFDVWCTAYTNVKESSKLFNDIYGLQMTMMVSTIVFYYIIFLYSLTSLSVTGNTELVDRGFYIFSLLLLLINLTMLSFAAQRTQNRVEILKRRLSKLLIHSLANEDYYRSTKDLLRLVSTRPIKTEAFGSISVDMSLLPTCVVFFTYYTVIALQFNNIV